MEKTRYFKDGKYLSIRYPDGTIWDILPHPGNPFYSKEHWDNIPDGELPPSEIDYENSPKLSSAKLEMMDFGKPGAWEQEGPTKAGILYTFKDGTSKFIPLTDDKKPGDVFHTTDGSSLTRLEPGEPGQILTSNQIPDYGE